MPISPQITITPEDITYKSFDISAVSYTSSTATYTATGHTYSAGDIVTITGLAPDGYNGTYTISGVATNTFTVANTTNTALTDQTGNSYWASATDYTYDGGQTVAFLTNNLDLLNPDLNQAIAAAALANTNATTAISLAGTKNTVFYSGTTPTANANGDLWINTASGNKLYQWNGSSWVSVQDTAIAAAAAAATAAQSTADGKNKIYRQGTTPTGTFAIGDIWFNTASDNAISRWDGSSWVATSLGTNALANFSANKITSGTIDASVVTVSNINAGNISTGTLAADRIAAASITGSKIAAATITASNIATGTITATQIAAGTITATEISSSYVYAGSITAGQITAGTLTGFTIQTSSGTTAVSMNASTNAISFKVGGSNVGHIVPLSSNGVIIHYGATADGTGGTRPQMYVGSSNVSLQADTTNVVGVSTTGVSINGSTSLNGTTYAAGNRTGTTSAANTFFNSSSGYWTYTTSSQRYKVEIEPQEIPKSSVLALQPKSYIDKGQFEENDNKSDGLQRMLGLIAEDVATIPVIGSMLANLNKDGQPDSVNYERVAVALIPLLKEHEARISALEGAK